MTALRDLESDVEAIDAFLMSDQSPEDCMQLSELDGFLTGVAIGPDLVMASEWLPRVWGGDEEPVFDSPAQIQTIMGAIMRRYNDILGSVARGELEPIFLETPAGEAVATDWAGGFIEAIALRAESWESLFKSDEHFASLVPILALCSKPDGEPVIPIDEDLEDDFFLGAAEMIPQAALEIAEFWRAARPPRPARAAGLKVGRNDPCPCGSGRKHKKCCGRAN